VHVIDASVSSAKIVDAYRTVRAEMERFRPELAHRPTLLAFNKMDVPGARESAERALDRLNFPAADVYHISAVSGEGISALLDGLLSLRQKRAADAS
jgi:GTP-binding protein